jgi:acyl-CoA synthetase (NDP forming)
MPGKRVAIITNLHGQGDLALRYLDENGLAPAPPSEEVAKKIIKKSPQARVGEFVSLGGSGGPEEYKFAVEQILEAEVADGVMIVCDVGVGGFEIDDLLKVMEKRPKESPIVGTVLAPKKREEVLEALAGAKTPVFESVEQAAVGLRISHSRYEIVSGFEKASEG